MSNNSNDPITPNLDRYKQESETPSPETPEAMTDDSPAQREEKVEFTPAQQLKLDDIIKKSMGRAGSEARAEAANANRKAAELQAEVERLKAGAIPNSRSAELEASRLHVAALQKQLTDGRTAQTLSDALADGSWVNAGVVSDLLKAKIAWNTETNKPVVLDAEGLPRLNKDYDPMTLKEMLTEFAEAHPYLVRGTTKSGSASAAATRSTLGADAVRVEQIFGKNSNSALANRTAIRSPREYAAMKLEAQRRGLI